MFRPSIQPSSRSLREKASTQSLVVAALPAAKKPICRGDA